MPTAGLTVPALATALKLMVDKWLTRRRQARHDRGPLRTSGRFLTGEEMVPLDRETLNALIEVLEDWGYKLQHANIDEIAELLGENQHEDDASCDAAQQVCKPDGLS
ncbi:MAG: hypothetical protein JJ926_12865 [Roseitalea sp.]|nr:hypothetical protein [Roseitalea sp.]MBO6952769.1 hypothetical protein [Rhizobiaceae bacterium]MBO6592744.1 hypothetical protein [Roseitalea sp.]MBO6600513.1 hypothetical protein [Roseitalea sp.]MBO6612945.1 hypothetical protein [Roseitalea sp.]